MSRVPGRGAMLALLLGAFVVALAYGVALPILPYLLERKLGPAGGVAWHTGLLTATYMFALFLFAPLWGGISDRWQRRGVILVGLAGFAAALLVFAFIDSLVTLYLGRFMSGAFAGAIVPVALATLADWAPNEQVRARHFAWLNIATIAGTLAGPAVGALLGDMWNRGMPASGLPFATVAFAAAATALLALGTLPVAAPAPRKPTREHAPPRAELRLLLLFSLLVAWALGTFEVGLALRARDELSLGPRETGLMFVECMVVMALAQLLVFNPWFPAGQTRRLLFPTFILLAVGLLLVARADNRDALLLAIVALAAAAGILSPVIAFWTSLAAGDVQGGELGRQTSAASFGQAVGSAAGGSLFGIAVLGGPFLVAAVLSLLGAILALPFSSRLAALANHRPGGPGTQLRH